MKYYVSAIGSDTNTGTRPSAPWKTLDKVNAQRFQPGDQVLFRRGDTFYGKIIPFGNRSQNVRPISYGNYGTGELPIISRYKVIPASSWVLHSAGVWKVDLTNLANFTGDQEVTVQGVNVGFLKYGSTIYPNKKWSVATLANQWDFYSDNLQYLYVKLDTIPGVISAPIGQRIIDSVTYSATGYRVSGLHLKGCGGHAINGTLQDTVVTGCMMGELGGGELIGFSTPNTRYGNGVEMWNGSFRTLATGNVIYDVYDVGCTMQGNLVTPASGWSDCWFTKNLIMRCNQSFEVWATGVDNVTPPAAGSGFHRTGFLDNICIDAGKSWGSSARPDQTTKAHLLLYTITVPDVDILVAGNKFYKPVGALISRGGNTSLPTGYVLKNNQVFLEADVPILYGLSYKWSDWDAFATYIGTGSDTVSTLVTSADTNLTLVQAVNKLSEAVTSSSASQSFMEKVSCDLFATAAAALDDVTSLRSDSLFTGFESQSSSVVGDYYAKLLVITGLDSQARIDGSFLYHIGGDSTTNRQGLGLVSFQFNPISGGSYFNMDVVELLPFRTGPDYTDFKAVFVEDALATGGKVQLEIYFNIGKDNFQRLKVMPTSMMISGSLNGAYQYRGGDALITSLPAGTQVTATGNSAAWQKKPLTGTTAPSSVPLFVGQSYLDTTNKKSYTAFGTASSADWVALN